MLRNNDHGDIERDIGHARNSFDLFVYVVGYEMIFN